jgi:small GTP-binding protein
VTVTKKIVLLGDCAVGKTSLIRRYAFNRLDDSYRATVGSKVTTKHMRFKTPNRTEKLKLMIWDLVGCKGYHALQAMTFVGADAALLVSDMTRSETLDNLDIYWIPSLFNIVDSVPLVFVCNKSDLSGGFEFEFNDMLDVTEDYNAEFDDFLPSNLEYNYSTSIKNRSCIDEAFKSLGHLVLRNDAPVDPVKELYEGILATDICKSSEKSTPIGALDAVIVDFCKGFKDTRIAMYILRQEIAKAGIDIREPTKEGVLKVVGYLAEAESGFMDENKVYSNYLRRMKWARNIKESRYHHYTEDAFDILRPTI